MYTPAPAKGAFTKDVLSEGGGGGYEKRTGLYFPILFVKDFGDKKDEGGGGGSKGPKFRGRPL